MKDTHPSPFGRLTAALLVSIALLTIAGRATFLAGAGALCTPWPFCIPVSPYGWIKLVHVGLAAISSLLIARVLFMAWRQYRTDRLLLPLATVTAVLFFGQVFVGAMQVARGFPEHLRRAAYVNCGFLVDLSCGTRVRGAARITGLACATCDEHSSKAGGLPGA